MQALGTPTVEQWPLLPRLPDFSTSFPKFRGKVRDGSTRTRARAHPAAAPHARALRVPQSWARIAPNLDADGLDLLSHLLVYDPAHRYSAAEALAHPYFADLTHPPPSAGMRLGASTAATGGVVAAGATAVPAAARGGDGGGGAAASAVAGAAHAQDADGDDVM